MTEPHALPSQQDSPEVALEHLDHLWFQVTGTLCNLTCSHCFISCSPKNDSFGYLSLQDVKRRLEESVSLGVKEYYFTGGEPFLHPDLVKMIAAALDYGPVSVLTNGTVLKQVWLEELRKAVDTSLYSLEFRVSIDGFSPETNDPIRGEGTFVRAIEGVQKMVAYGFLPIITAARTWSEEEDQQIVGQFIAILKAAGYKRPRLKLLPALKIGAEAERTCGYRETERVTADMMEDFDETQLVCNHSRVVTDRGVYVCPILIESADANLGQTLAESNRPFALSHGACYTCYQYGSFCSNASSTSSLE